MSSRMSASSATNGSGNAASWNRQPAVLDLDDDLVLGLVAKDRLERLVQVDLAVVEPLDVQHARGEAQRRAFGRANRICQRLQRNVGLSETSTVAPRLSRRTTAEDLGRPEPPQADVVELDRGGRQDGVGRALSSRRAAGCRSTQGSWREQAGDRPAGSIVRRSTIGDVPARGVGGIWSREGRGSISEHIISSCRLDLADPTILRPDTLVLAVILPPTANRCRNSPPERVPEPDEAVRGGALQPLAASGIVGDFDFPF